MRNLLAVLLAAFGVGLIPSPVRADLIPPVPAPREVKFAIEVDEKAKGPKLVVPMNLMNPRVRPRPVPGKQAKEPLAVLEYDGESETPIEPSNNRNHLMIAGVALTLAIGLGGVWFIRRNGTSTTRGLALLIAAGSTLAATTLVWANAPPPTPLPPKEFVALPVAFDGKLTLEMVGRGDTIVLVLDTATYEAIKKEPKKPKEK